MQARLPQDQRCHRLPRDSQTRGMLLLFCHQLCPVSRLYHAASPSSIGAFSQQRLLGSKGSERRMRSPSPSLPFSPLSPGLCSELSDPLSLPGREEGEDKFIPVPEQKALCAQTQRGRRIRGAPGIRKAWESSKSFGEGATWHGVVDADPGRGPGDLLC